MSTATTKFLRTLALTACLGSLGATTASAADSGMEKQLRELADRTAIDAVLMQYTYGLDLVDADMYAGVFTPEAKFYRGATPDSAVIMAEGTAQIRKIITDLAASDAAGKARREAEWEGEGEAPARLRHHVMTNSVVELVDGNNARHRAYWMTVAGSGREMTVLAMGSYEDKLVKRDGKWLINERYLLAR
jgi:hypothetical protein